MNNEEDHNNQSPQLAYVLPNLFTAASIFTGILSILDSSNGRFYYAIALIVLSLIFDGLDGRVARLTKTTSKFGVEFDSLADLVAFGVAPAMLFYYTIGHNFGNLGSLITAVYVMFGAIRLARFNVTTGTYEPNVFIGLPIPTAAITAAFWIGIYLKYQNVIEPYSWVYFLLMILLSFLMVSNIRYPSFKKTHIEKANLIKILVILVIVFSIIWLNKIWSIAVLTAVYILYGLIRTAYNIFVAKFGKKD